MALDGFELVREHSVARNLKQFRAVGGARSGSAKRRNQEQSRTVQRVPVFAYARSLVRDFDSPWEAAAEFGFALRSIDRKYLIENGSWRKGHVIIWLKTAPIPDDVPNGLVFA